MPNRDIFTYFGMQGSYINISMEKDIKTREARIDIMHADIYWKRWALQTQQSSDTVVEVTENQGGGQSSNPQQTAYTQPAPEPSSESPQPEQPPPPKPQPSPHKAKVPTMLIAIAGVAIILAIFAYIWVNNPYISQPHTTTIPNAKSYAIGSCEVINSPGTYYLTQDISTNIQNGSCISIESSDVALEGRGHLIHGNGPFKLQAPYSYGVSVKNQSNVSIDGLGIYRFSYNVYLSNVKNAHVSNMSLYNATISGLYIRNSLNGVFLNDSAVGTSSNNGGITLAGGTGNRLQDNTASGNAYYGMVINSTGNTFVGGSYKSNPISDLLCVADAGYRKQNTFSGVSCETNAFCQSAFCSIRNVPIDLANITLHNTINSCGIIDAPGNYALSSNLYLPDYVNVSEPAYANAACIEINASDVNLNCMGRVISGAHYGISASGVYNLQVNNCRLSNDTYGAYLYGVFNSSIRNTSASSSGFGIYMLNSLKGLLTNTSFSNDGDAGLYLGNVSGISVDRLSSSANPYGIYFQNGTGNTFSNTTLKGNSNTDFYCSADSYNSSLNILQSSTCQSTDCNWASECVSYQLPPLPTQHVNSCGVISLSGNYEVTSNMVYSGSGACLDIKAKDVNLACDGHLIKGNEAGTGVSVDNMSGVAISGCNLLDLSYGIKAISSPYLILRNNTVTSSEYSIYLQNDTGAVVVGTVSNLASSSGFVLNNVNDSIITQDGSYNGLLGTTPGFVLSNSSYNIFVNNTSGLNGGNGFNIINSRSNLISNNTAYSNNIDYFCSPSSSGIYADDLGVNSGATKQNCSWLVEVNAIQKAQTSCYDLSSPSYIRYTEDVIYTYGSTCIDVTKAAVTSGSGSEINCGGHTVLSTSGGTFVDINNVTNVTVANCKIIGFDYAIKGTTAGSVTLLNDTIAGAQYGILLSGSKHSLIYNDSISNSSYGIYYGNGYYSTIKDNFVANSNVSMELAGDTGFTVEGNSEQGSATGLYLVNSSITTVGNNRLQNNSLYGIYCAQGSGSNSSLNKDTGNNVCSSNYQCGWMTSSGSCAVSSSASTSSSVSTSSSSTSSSSTSSRSTSPPNYLSESQITSILGTQAYYNVSYENSTTATSEVKAVEHEFNQEINATINSGWSVTFGNQTASTAGNEGVINTAQSQAVYSLLVNGTKSRYSLQEGYSYSTGTSNGFSYTEAVSGGSYVLTGWKNTAVVFFTYNFQPSVSKPNFGSLINAISSDIS